MDIIRQLNGLIWGLPTLLLILGVGILLTVKTGFYQIIYLPKAFSHFISRLKPTEDSAQGVSAYQALCTALGATVGTGNIAGVAGAIAIGGPGAVFWMWVCAVFGMILKCAEATLSVYYRRCDENGDYLGGPMYMIENGLGHRWRWLACLYGFFGVVAAFGVGNATQINAILTGIHSAASAFQIRIGRIEELCIAAFLAILVCIMLLGGAKRVGRIAQALVPYAAMGYILLGLGVLIVCRQNILPAFSSIIRGAFSPEAVTGGAVGSVFAVCRTGAARGIFSNEAGMGTASIAHASARVSHPAEQGLMGIIEVFIDTILICTVTALVILCSGVSISYGSDTGAELTFLAFSNVYGDWVTLLITAALICFALATVLGWGYYGLRCAQYLFGRNILPVFIAVQGLTVFLSSLLKTGTLWLLAETVNGLMAIPNLITLVGLCPVFVDLIKQYKTLLNIPGGTNENLNQCKSVRTFSNAEISPVGTGGAEKRKDHLSSEYWPAGSSYSGGVL